MKLWPTMNENKCFVKMLWHLLGECVKAIILLVCSICTVYYFFFLNNFFSHRFVLSFLYIKSANRLMNSVMNNIFGLVTCLFPLFFPFKFTNLVWACFFLLKDFICLLFTCNVSLHCIHTKNSKIIYICNKYLYKFCKCVQHLLIFMCLQYKFTL